MTNISNQSLDEMQARDLIEQRRAKLTAWRKEGGAERMYQIAKREEFYKQEYCGCIYSLRDTNDWRESKGRDKITIGEEFYEEKLI